MENDMQFDRAEFATPATANCRGCKQPLQHEYYSVNGQVLCGRCAASLRAQLGGGGGVGGKATRFLKAAGLGICAAILGGAVYGAVMAYNDSQWALISIGVGYFVGKAVRLGSNGRGGWRYQLIAALLTYLAICGAYAFALYHALPEPGLGTVIGVVLLSYRLPFMGGTENIFGILIIGLGVFQAWRMNQGIDAQITGPYPLTPGPTVNPPAGA